MAEVGEPREARAPRREHLAQAQTASGLALVVGIWLIISPFILNYAASQAFWSQIITGIVIGVMAIGRMVEPRVSWMGWINVIAGIWLIISPFILAYATPAAYWNSVIFGVVTLILASISTGATANWRERSHA